MKLNDKKNLREKSVLDLQTQIQAMQKEMSVVRMQFAVGKIKDVKLMSKLRAKIAIMKTIIGEKNKLSN